MADRYCRNCGHKLGSEDRFCANCGQPGGSPVAMLQPSGPFGERGTVSVEGP